MSLRRKSCEWCFKARRKCDLTYPTCRACERRGKQCEYAYPPQQSSYADINDLLENEAPQKTAGPLSPQTLTSSRPSKAAEQWHLQAGQARSQSMQRRLGTPEFPSPQGHLKPPESVDTVTPNGFSRLAWVYDQIRDAPNMFAKQAETLFIHRELLEQHFPRPLRAAFGICAATATMNDMNNSFMFRAIDAEVTDLLAARHDTNLLDGLVLLQAAVLYQIIRLYRGGWQQRLVAEQQEFLVRSYALTILSRADAELQHAPRTWETWILFESVRRTVMMAFKIYTLYWSLQKQICFEIEGLNLLPVSTRPELWSTEGKELYNGQGDPDAVMAHEEFTIMMRQKDSLEPTAPFQKLLILGCKQKVWDSVLENLGEATLPCGSRSTKV